MENKTWFKKYLPSQTTRVVSNPGVIFTIIIGRRTENSLEIEKRNQIADELKINIRSFDYLTDLLERRRFFNNACLDINGELWLENQIENPFYKAISLSLIHISISRWSKNEMQPSLETLSHIAMVLKIDIRDLLNPTLKKNE